MFSILFSKTEDDTTCTHGVKGAKLDPSKCICCTHAIEQRTRQQS